MMTLMLPMEPTNAAAGKSVIASNDVPVPHLWISPADALGERPGVSAPMVEAEPVYLELTPDVVAAIEWGLDAYAADTDFLATH